MSTSRRGRPRLDRPKVDLGTPELARKRALGLTEELLDSCHRRGLIDDMQHWCGIHLRWLHTLRYGACSVQAVDWLTASHMPVLTEDPEWRTAREQEYHEAVLHLRTYNLDQFLLNIVVYNSPHIALQEKLIYNTVFIGEYEIIRLKEALDYLAALWCKRSD